MEKYVLLVRLGYHVSIQARMDKQSQIDKNGSFPLTHPRGHTCLLSTAFILNII